MQPEEYLEGNGTAVSRSNWQLEGTKKRFVRHRSRIRSVPRPNPHVWASLGAANAVNASSPVSWLAVAKVLEALCRGTDGSLGHLVT